VLLKARAEIEPKAKEVKKRFVAERKAELAKKKRDVPTEVIERAASEQILSREFVVQKDIYRLHRIRRLKLLCFVGLS
jgi:hypothetical protein